MCFNKLLKLANQKDYSYKQKQVSFADESYWTLLHLLNPTHDFPAIIIYAKELILSSFAYSIEK